jgi:hypothetical protein
MTVSSLYPCQLRFFGASAANVFNGHSTLLALASEFACVFKENVCVFLGNGLVDVIILGVVL